MIPINDALNDSSGRIPRESGDDPDRVKVFFLANAYSPRERG